MILHQDPPCSDDIGETLPREITKEQLLGLLNQKGWFIVRANGENALNSLVTANDEEIENSFAQTVNQPQQRYRNKKVPNILRVKVFRINQSK